MTTIRLKKRQAAGRHFAKFSAEERLKLVGGYAVSAYGVPRETGDKAAGPLDLSDAEYILQSSPVKIDLELLVNKARELKINRRLTRMLKRFGKQAPSTSITS